MLKQELNKLRTEDIEKKKIREKRKELSTKEQIIQKEQADDSLLKNMRNREKVLIQTRHMNMMKNNMDKVGHIENLERWVKRGFRTSSTVMRSLKLSDNPELSILSKKATSPIKIEKNTNQDDWIHILLIRS